MNGSATIGSLSVMALTLTSEAASRGILGESSWNAYRRLREVIRECVGDDESLLERLPTSAAMSARISLAIEQSIEYRARIKSLAAALIEALKGDVRRGSLGVSLRKLDVIQAHLEEIA